ncbi:hypothetical protein GQ55_2G279000 [Panicum hallii var. hallii]|uniref:Uncharacterized protein n=1 Tax=Panicum hallii var. hallii TaxID=1504633 RepID=A0A2T7ET35_9POAL|nr:hypothetical protein GQ55_2G279000 [Panicum hallii var. hallii]
MPACSSPRRGRPLVLIRTDGRLSRTSARPCPLSPPAPATSLRHPRRTIAHLRPSLIPHDAPLHRLLA